MPSSTLRPDEKRRDISLNEMLADALLEALSAGVGLEFRPHGERLQVIGTLADGRQAIDNIALPPRFLALRKNSHRASLSELQESIRRMVERLA